MINQVALKGAIAEQASKRHGRFAAIESDDS
jgi:hypothetical protein